jgi:hypothetical protein
MAYIHTDFMRGVVQLNKKMVHHINAPPELLEQKLHHSHPFTLDP